MPQDYTAKKNENKLPATGSTLHDLLVSLLLDKLIILLLGLIVM